MSTSITVYDQKYDEHCFERWCYHFLHRKSHRFMHFLQWCKNGHMCRIFFFKDLSFFIFCNKFSILSSYKYYAQYVPNSVLNAIVFVIWECYLLRYTCMKLDFTLNIIIVCTKNLSLPLCKTCKVDVVIRKWQVKITTCND